VGGALRVVRRLASAGVADARADEVRYVELVNVAALAAIALVALYLPFLFAAGGLLATAVTALQIPAFLAVIGLNRRGHLDLARLWLIVASLTAFVGQVLLFGPGGGHTMFVLGFAAAPALLFGPRSSAIAAVTTAAGLLV
jgi:hypothetical protein